MAYSFKTFEKRVALLIVFSVVVVSAAAIFITANRGMFRAHTIYRTEFKSAKDLRENMRITLQNVQIGKLRTMQLNNENTIDVTVEVDRRYVDRVREDSVLVLKPGLLGGAGELVLYPGMPDTARLERNAFLQSSDTERGQLLKRKYELAQRATGLDAALDNVVELTEGFKTLPDDVKQLMGSLNSVMDDASVIVNDLAQYDEETGGVVGMLLYDIEMRKRLERDLMAILAYTASMMSNLDSTMRVVNERNEDIDAIIVSLRANLENLESITGGSGNPQGAAKRKR